MQDKELLIRHFLEYAMFIPGSLGFLLPVRNFVNIEKRTLIAATAAINLLFLVIGPPISLFFELSTSTVNSVMMIIPLVISMFIVDLRRTQILFAFLNSVMVCSWASIITVYAFAPIEVSFPDGPLQIGSALFCLGLSFFMLFLMNDMLLYKFPVMFQIPELDFMWNYIWICPAVITLFLFWVNPVNVSFILMGRIYQMSLVIWMMIMIGIYFFYQFLWRFSQKLTREQYLIEEMRVLNAEKNRFSQMESYVYELRSLRHDLRQHLRVLSSMAASNQIDEMKQYLNKYVESVQPEYSSFCSNYAVDAIAAYYQEYADKMDVRIVWNLFLPPRLPIDETELCVIIGNLLENAIRASEKVEPSERLIEASIRMAGDNMIGIEIRNHYIGKIYLNREGIPAPKDREGIGLYSVSNTVRKNNGTLSVEVDDEWFCVDIIINIFSDTDDPDRDTPKEPVEAERKTG